VAPRQPTQPNISALLRKAGFERSASSPSGVKGTRIRSDGYVVTSGTVPGIVWVWHEVANLQPLPQDQRRIASMHAKYATAIEAAGFSVGRRKDRLVVSAPAETKED
jgi:hypothetical protein